MGALFSKTFSPQAAQQGTQAEIAPQPKETYHVVESSPLEASPPVTDDDKAADQNLATKAANLDECETTNESKSLIEIACETPIPSSPPQPEKSSNDKTEDFEPITKESFEHVHSQHITCEEPQQDVMMGEAGTGDLHAENETTECEEIQNPDTTGEISSPCQMVAAVEDLTTGMSTVVISTGEPEISTSSDEANLVPNDDDEIDVIEPDAQKTLQNDAYVSHQDLEEPEMITGENEDSQDCIEPVPSTEIASLSE